MIASFFGPLELVPPGLVEARHWGRDPASPASPSPPREGQIIIGVARVTLG